MRQVRACDHFQGRRDLVELPWRESTGELLADPTQVRSRRAPKEGSSTLGESRLDGSRILPGPFALDQAVRDQAVHPARQRARWNQNTLGEIAHPEAIRPGVFEPKHYVVGVEGDSVLRSKL